MKLTHTKTLTNKEGKEDFDLKSFYSAKTFTIASRVLWNGGVSRIAVEEARNAKAKLFVYRESFHNYDLSDINVTPMRRGKKGTGLNALASNRNIRRR